jgi:carboxypeptidase C (cathepsin A)
MRKFFILFVIFFGVSFGEKVNYLPLYGVPDETQYAGHHEISTNSFLFYWFFEKKTSNLADEPVIIWLNGGPGCSSMTGAFVELGPYKFDIKNETSFKLVRNEHTWLKLGHLLFIDQPLGTGLSFTEKTYADTQEVATNHLFSLIQGLVLKLNIF